MLAATRRHVVSSCAVRSIASAAACCGTCLLPTNCWGVAVALAKPQGMPWQGASLREPMAWLAQCCRQLLLAPAGVRYCCFASGEAQKSSGHTGQGSRRCRGFGLVVSTVETVRTASMMRTRRHGMRRTDGSQAAVFVGTRLCNDWFRHTFQQHMHRHRSCVGILTMSQRTRRRSGLVFALSRQCRTWLATSRT